MTAFEQALEAQSVPGTNLKGSIDGPNWRFLLPRLELGRVLALGCPAPSALATVARLSDEMVVWDRVAHHDRLRGMIEKRSLGNVRILSAERGAALPLDDDDVDVVVVASPRLAGWVGAGELAGRGAGHRDLVPLSAERHRQAHNVPLGAPDFERIDHEQRSDVPPQRFRACRSCKNSTGTLTPSRRPISRKLKSISSRSSSTLSG